MFETHAARFARNAQDVCQFVMFLPVFHRILDVNFDPAFGDVGVGE